MQINSSTTWQPVKTQLTCSRLFKFLPFSRCYSNKPFLQTMAAKTRFSHYQKASNGKINSTEVFLMMKGTSVWKIIPNELCYQRQDLKNRFFEVWLQEYASNCKTNSTGVFLAMKGTSVWKSAQMDFAIDHKIRKNQLGSFMEFTNCHFSLCQTFAITVWPC